MRWLAVLAAASTTFTLHLGQNVVLPNAKPGDTIACVGHHGRLVARAPRLRAHAAGDHLFLSMRHLIQGGIAANCSTEPSDLPLGFEPFAVGFISSSHGWEAGREGCETCVALRVTNDGGRTWGDLPRPPFRIRDVPDIAFADAVNGYAFGDGLYSTHDGGRTWHRGGPAQVLSLGVGAGFAFALAAAEPKGGGVVDLWRSNVGGDAWRMLGQFSAPYGMGLAVDGRVVALLRDGSSAAMPGGVWVSRSSWRRWTQHEAPCRSEAQGASAIGLTRGASNRWLVDCFDNRQSSQAQHTTHHLYETTDAGSTWHRLADPSHAGVPTLLAATNTGTIVLATSGIADELHASFDGGRSFRRLFFSGGSFFGWADLQFFGTTGFVVGPTHYSPEHVYRTDDGGRHWRLIDSG